MNEAYEAALEVRAAIDSLGNEVSALTYSLPDQRERIATAAMVGYLAMYAGDGVECPDPENAAARAVEYADALIVQLNEPPTGETT